MRPVRFGETVTPMISLLHIAMARELAEYRMREVRRDAPRRFSQEDVPSPARALSAPLPRDDGRRPERQVTGNRARRSWRRRTPTDTSRRSARQGVDHG